MNRVLGETPFFVLGISMMKVGTAHFAYRHPIIPDKNNLDISKSDIALHNGICAFCFPVYWSMTKLAVHLFRENPLEKDVQCKIISSTQVEPVEYIPCI